jgi:hypothetical protein
MSTFYAKFAMKVIELFPWLSIWSGEVSAANSSMIIRWKQWCPVYSQLGIMKRWKCSIAARWMNSMPSDDLEQNPVPTRQIETLEVQYCCKNGRTPCQVMILRESSLQLGRMKRWKCSIAARWMNSMPSDNLEQNPVPTRQIETLEVQYCCKDGRTPCQAMNLA